MTTPSRFDELLHRYFSGQMSSEEKASFEKKSLADPELKAEMTAWLTIKATITKTEESKRKNFIKASYKSWNRKNTRKKYTWIGAAATIALLIGAFISLQLSKIEKQNKYYILANEYLKAHPWQTTMDVVPIDSLENIKKEAVKAYYEENYMLSAKQFEKFQRQIKKQIDIPPDYDVNLYLAISYLMLIKNSDNRSPVPNPKPDMPLAEKALIQMQAIPSNQLIHEKSLWYQVIAYLYLNQPSKAIDLLDYMINHGYFFNRPFVEAMLKKLNP